MRESEGTTEEIQRGDMTILSSMADKLPERVAVTLVKLPKRPAKAVPTMRFPVV